MKAMYIKQVRVSVYCGKHTYHLDPTVNSHSCMHLLQRSMMFSSRSQTMHKFQSLISEPSLEPQKQSTKIVTTDIQLMSTVLHATAIENVQDKMAVPALAVTKGC